ncbi:hypothetical protein C5Z25_05265 [Lactobacillus sp. CBA3605]|uniref:hypothetical protein n=1 Tax=Lactobacillus sp. CBA3605 TaxID=2099788 RepID=UPI000CFC11CD|nr:hypothetical protein [Lactobacillus sp. CBA3605]AVK61206.1 hypothetical protein C5Z25_05265 [Lactobacillus sp. CBA3605]
MQDDTILGIVTMIFLGATLYVGIASVISIFVIRQFRSNVSIRHFRKYRGVRKVFLFEPFKESKKQQVAYKLYRMAMVGTLAMYIGQIIIANYGYAYFATIMMCLLCLAVWWGTILLRARRDYWKGHPHADFTLVSDRRFRTGQLLFKSILVALMIMSISYSISAVNFGPYY